MGKKGTPHRRFSKEEKLRIKKIHLEEHKSVTQIERETGILVMIVPAGTADMPSFLNNRKKA